MPDLPEAIPVERPLLEIARMVLLAVAVCVQFALGGPEFLAQTRLPGFRPIYAAVYAVLALVGVVCAVYRLRRVSPPAVVVGAGVVVLLACSVAMSASLPAEGAPRAEHWSFGLVGWYGIALLFDVALVRLGLFLLVHAAVSVGPVLAVGSLPDLTRMGVVTISVTGFQFGVAMTANLIRIIARTSARSSAASERLRVREAAAAASLAEHERRYADLRHTTVPLLRGLASGALDPRDPSIRHRCAVDAGRMRRLFSESADVVDRLAHELTAFIDVAERHGVHVHLSVRGTPRTLPDVVRHELLAPIAETLMASRATARVTLLWTNRRVRVSLTCPRPDPPVAGPRTEHVTVTESTTDHGVWTETSWRSP
ncbi:hypothetical protein [Actinophytocola oryzae]|uniref:Signal transduction histidine kinase n=1 Tax=Actinophytocola oryzae TaxID=502181 RepID=A0A4R7W0X5_9PSEU|nr:hypothetical protein [Actinophytocola oryzae]TDV56180.1 hypothetical protein CLV71_102246 [Actinophytocola oryzae]